MTTLAVVHLQAATAQDEELLHAVSTLLAANGGPEDADYGYQWRVQVVEYGPGKDGRINWPREPLVAALGQYDGAKVFALKESQHLDKPKKFGKSVREIVGWLANPSDTGTGIEADLYILKSARWLRDNLVDSHQRGNPTLFGLSHDVSATSREVMVAGRKMREPVKILGVEVDVVYDPTNNGKFLHMAAASGRENAMDLEKLLAALQKAKPQVYATLNLETITADEVLEKLTAAVEQHQEPDIDGKIQAAVATIGQPVAEELRKLRILRSDLALDQRLAASKLPDIGQRMLRTRFAGTEYSDEQLTAAIQETKEMIDQVSGSGTPQGVGGARVVRDSTDKLQAACDRMFGVQVGDTMADIPAFTGLRAAYVELTGDTEVRGYLEPGQMPSRLQAAYGTATFNYVLGNTLYRRMVQDYRETTDFGLGRLLGGRVRNATDFRTMESVRIGYYGDLPVVDTEKDDYPDLGEVGEEKVEYALSQRGGIITITRKMIINDDMRVVERTVSRLPRAARRGRAKRGFGKFINNTTYGGDSKAIFHTDHGNLGAAAYGITSALAAKTAMAKQAEPGSGERLMFRPVTVVFPSELFGIVRNVNTFSPQAVAIADGNSMEGFFQPEGLVECPFMEDANNWMMFADPNECEILEMACLNGQEAPEMFVADQPAVGQMFVADKIMYKIRQEDEFVVLDYRGCYAGIVA